ncbi:MAG: hypothetical protein K2I42_03420 [Anaeroplasmataceae bacterium]|nr:hypothetical protein [Anaeroplasmataceae bacterium]
MKKILNSSCFYMVFTSFIAFFLASIECIFLTYSPDGAFIVMILGIILFIGLFINVLISKKRYNVYNYLILVFIALWIYCVIKYLSLAVYLTNNGKWYHRLGFHFPCTITLSTYDFFTKQKIHTKNLCGYFNWLFSIFMLVFSFLILLIKEKFKKNVNQS